VAKPKKARSLDHVVAIATDLEGVRSMYSAMGFHVLPIMRHIEIGTSNTLIQFQNTYLEFVADIDRGPRFLSDRVLPRLKVGPGLIMLSLTSDGLSQDCKALVGQGIATDPILNARRAVQMPDGSETETDSSSTYTWNPEGNLLSLFLSEHRRRSAIWIPEYQKHANQASDVVAITYAVDGDPHVHATYFSAMLGSPPQRSAPGELVFLTPRGERIELVNRAALARRFEDAQNVQISASGQGYALTLRVADFAEVQRILDLNHVAHRAKQNQIVVPAASAAGIVLAFTTEPA
jgi:hypothetical protein